MAIDQDPLAALCFEFDLVTYSSFSFSLSLFSTPSRTSPPAVPLSLSFSVSPATWPVLFSFSIFYLFFVCRFLLMFCAAALLAAFSCCCYCCCFGFSTFYFCVCESLSLLPPPPRSVYLADKERAARRFDCLHFPLLLLLRSVCVWSVCASIIIGKGCGRSPWLNESWN